MRDIEKINVPQFSEETKTDIFSHFGHILFFTTLEKGRREYVCSACKRKFVRGTKVPLRTVTPNDRVLDTARHNSEAVCPYCETKATVVNTKFYKSQKIELTQAVSVFYALDENTVVARCAFFVREYHGTSGNYSDIVNETAKYILTPEGALCFKKPWNYVFGWGGGLYPSSFQEPFAWNCGLMHQSFVYTTYTASALSCEQTFLKYNAYDLYNKKRYLNVPFMKYLCWYCEHPQMEMLVKLGRYEAVDALIQGNRENRSIINWDAKTPWELHRLDKATYNEWVRTGGGMERLKIYGALRGKGIKDLLLADKIRKYAWNGTDAKNLCRKILRCGASIKDAIKYFDRVSNLSAGACHHCPGITAREAADMWSDYIAMSGADKKNSNLPPFPADLKTAHDNCLSAKRLAEAQKERKQRELEAKRTRETLKKKAAELALKYKKADKNLEHIKEKYEYDNGKYCFVVAESIFDVLYDGTVLNQCTARPDSTGTKWRYLERIDKNETYIGFIRHSKTPDVPFFTVEFEPGGTVRQKRAYGDDQPKNLMPKITKFLIEWQKEIAPRLDKSDKAAAQRAKVVRCAEFRELRKNKNTVNYGKLRGTLLIDAFENDLMEINALG